jgi:hypothetical protein
MKSRTAGVAGLAVAAMALAGCGSTAPSHQAAATQAAAVPAATHSQSCAQQAQAWYHDQGKAQLNQLTSEESAISRDAPAVADALSSGGDVTTAMAKWQADSTALETDAQSAAANPPPACADAGDYGTAMQDYETAAKDYLSAVSDMSNGDFTSADTLVKAGNTATDNGTTALGRATAAIQQG